MYMYYVYMYWLLFPARLHFFRPVIVETRQQRLTLVARQQVRHVVEHQGALVAQPHDPVNHVQFTDVIILAGVTTEFFPF